MHENQGKDDFVGICFKQGHMVVSKVLAMLYFLGWVVDIQVLS